MLFAGEKIRVNLLALISKSVPILRTDYKSAPAGSFWIASSFLLAMTLNQRAMRHCDCEERSRKQSRNKYNSKELNSPASEGDKKKAPLTTTGLWNNMIKNSNNIIIYALKKYTANIIPIFIQTNKKLIIFASDMKKITSHSTMKGYIPHATGDIPHCWR